MGKDITKLESMGIADTYLTLLKFIESFINKNFPLSRNDMIAITNDTTTDNTIKRQQAMNVMKEKCFN